LTEWQYVTCETTQHVMMMH